MRLFIGLLACLAWFVFSCAAVSAQDDNSGQQYNPYGSAPGGGTQYQPNYQPNYQPSQPTYPAPDTGYQPSNPYPQPTYTPPSDPSSITNQPDNTVPSYSGSSTYTPPATDTSSSTSTDTGSSSTYSGNSDSSSSSSDSSSSSSSSNDSGGGAAWFFGSIITIAIGWAILANFSKSPEPQLPAHSEFKFQQPREIVWARLRDYFAEETPILSTNWHVATADSDAGRMVANLSWTSQEQLGTETYMQNVHRAQLKQRGMPTITQLTSRISLTLFVVPEESGTKLTFDWSLQYQGEVNSDVPNNYLKQVQANVYSRLAQRLA